MLNVRYRGEFVGLDGVVWAVEILQEGYTGVVGELTFPHDTPLSITWEEIGKEEPIQGSVATLRIESPGDRSYIDLYTVEAGSITVMVYRDTRPYWSGCLDPEFYEEPYEKQCGYDVELTFTDFGILDRMKWNDKEIVSLDDIVNRAIYMACIATDIENYGFSRYTLSCSTELDGKPLSLEDVSISGENFFDEEGEPRTVKEVLKSILQPLSLRIIQRGGRVWVYDINKLASISPMGDIEWSGDRQTLSADRVVNSCTVTFSPYQKYTLLDGSVSVEDSKLTGASITYDIYSYKDRTDNEEYGEGLNKGFRIQPVDTDKVNLPYYIPFGVPNVRVMKITPILSGSNDVVVTVGRRGAKSTDYDTVTGYIVNAYDKTSDYLNDVKGEYALITKPVFINSGQKGEQTSMRLRISIDALVSPKYNPFEGPEFNEEKNWNTFQKKSRRAFIPGQLLLVDRNGKTLMYYSNRDEILATKGNSQSGGTMRNNWVAGEPTRPDEYMLCWNPTEQIGESPVWGDWETNVPPVRAKTTDPGLIYRKRERGDIISLPPMPGYIVLKVFNSIMYATTHDVILEYNGNYFLTRGYENNTDVDAIRWVMLKNPSIKITDLYGKDQDATDYECKGWINRYADEELNLSTECGTVDESSPVARGAFLYSDTHAVIYNMTRAGITDRVERLMIGTIYSQYSTRHNKLSGECDIVPWGLPVMAERNQDPAARFMLAGETQNCIEGVTEAIWVEVLADDWEGLEIEE